MEKDKLADDSKGKIIGFFDDWWGYYPAEREWRKIKEAGGGAWEVQKGNNPEGVEDEGTERQAEKGGVRRREFG